MSTIEPFAIDVPQAVLQDLGDRLARNVDGRLQPVDAGHWYEVEQPEFVARQLKAFWATLS